MDKTPNNEIRDKKIGEFLKVLEKAWKNKGLQKALSAKQEEPIVFSPKKYIKGEFPLGKTTISGQEEPKKSRIDILEEKVDYIYGFLNL